MSEYKIQVERRDDKKVKPSHLRQDGRVPGIYYAHDQENIKLSADRKELMRLLNTEATVVSVELPGGELKQSIVRDVQFDPVTDMPVHVDFMGIKLDEKVKLTIPIILTGSPAGVKEGGILEHILREIEVEGLPLDIPEHIDVDVSDLNVGGAIVLETIKSDKYTIGMDLHHPIAHVVMPKAVKAEDEFDVEAEEETEEEVSEE